MYRSENIDTAPYQPSKKEQIIAENAWELLHKWKTPPGTLANGGFDDGQFESWLQEVIKTCTESGALGSCTH